MRFAPNHSDHRGWIFVVKLQYDTTLNSLCCTSTTVQSSLAQYVELHRDDVKLVVYYRRRYRTVLWTMVANAWQLRQKDPIDDVSGGSWIKMNSEDTADCRGFLDRLCYWSHASSSLSLSLQHLTIAINIYLKYEIHNGFCWCIIGSGLYITSTTTTSHFWCTTAPAPTTTITPTIVIIILCWKRVAHDS